METEYGFTKLEPDEFASWLGEQSISRACLRVQVHHTWKPSYSEFTGDNHFDLQKSMQNQHVINNGWSDIGQHFTIFPDGVIVTGRALNSSPACISGANSGSICIENVGNFDIDGDDMSADQSASLFQTIATLLKNLVGVSEATKTNVVYHHWYDGNGGLVYENSGQKSCPGTAFFGGNRLEDYEANFLPQLKAIMSGGSVPFVEADDWAVVDARHLHIRTGPSARAERYGDHGSLPVGCVVRIYEVSDKGWIRIAPKRQLWIYGRLTSPVRLASVNSADSNARFGPGTDYDIGRVFQTGERVFVREEQDDWCLIIEGLWIHHSLLDYAD